MLTETCEEMSNSLEQDSSKFNIKNIVQTLRNLSTTKVA